MYEENNLFDPIDMLRLDIPDVHIGETGNANNEHNENTQAWGITSDTHIGNLYHQRTPLIHSNDFISWQMNKLIEGHKEWRCTYRNLTERVGADVEYTRVFEIDEEVTVVSYEAAFLFVNFSLIDKPDMIFTCPGDQFFLHFETKGD